eukprot:TRINITY_DN9260_c0_g1_i1.p4 TRINITY_DN9260_c0_g1~~TRINITY_DN9260_c0_g1_i1.p4  ORF type:complete len:138 (-),score=2.05 TRINITY_DN9260_c0_g1_i1:18-431(-)
MIKRSQQIKKNYNIKTISNEINMEIVQQQDKNNNSKKQIYQHSCNQKYKKNLPINSQLQLVKKNFACTKNSNTIDLKGQKIQVLAVLLQYFQQKVFYLTKRMNKQQMHTYNLVPLKRTNAPTPKTGLPNTQYEYFQQ